MPADPLTDQLRAASAEARRLVMAALPGSADVAPVKESPWVRETFDRLATPNRCRHLARRPLQPAFAFIWEGYWRCRACVADHVDEQRRAARAGTWAGLGTAEEGTCDRCRVEVGPANLTPAVLRSDLFILTAAFCPRCERQLQREGGRTLNP